MKIIRFNEIKQVPASHEDSNDPGTLKKVLVAAADGINGKIQMINWATMLPEKSFSAHIHKDMFEIFIMMGDGLIMEIDDKEIALGKGDALIVEPTEMHELKNGTKMPIEYIVIGIVE